jgi:hypothetical protein
LASLESVLNTYLTSQTDLTALVEDQIYYNEAEQEAQRPYIVIKEDGREKNYTHQGYHGWSIYSMEFAIYADSTTSAREVAVQLETALDSWHSANSLIQGAFQREEVLINLKDVKLVQLIIDYDIVYFEEV